ANYITQLKRSGYFQQVEIKESHQDANAKSIEVFAFTLTAQFGLPPTSGSTTAAAVPVAPVPAAAGKQPSHKTGNI
ncbi:MAG TPA: hypothetical protein VFE02_15330, partial [Candidatus Acidoferrales bacterium]|nr:hypothetical protein [Candidatus Acidoferrales bacterium]